MTQSDFIAKLFNPDDLILLRIIETWAEEGKKRSRVLQTRYAQANQVVAILSEPEMFEAAKIGNTFFGVCPRKGDKGQFDLACQIAKVSCLWADLDNCSPSDSTKRVLEEGLPTPSIVVSSGNGTHFYWVLSQSIEIAGALLFPIESNSAKGKTIGILGIGENDPEYSKLTALCPQAKEFKSRLAGIASRIGGDATTDLSRLLRMPGTMNRKGHRNGDKPTKCEVVSC